MHFRIFIVKRKGKKNWQSEIDTWQPIILLYLPLGAGFSLVFHTAGKRTFQTGKEIIFSQGLSCGLTA